MSTLQENQSLNAEYERNKKEREMQEEIERLNKIIEDIKKFIKGYDMDLLTYGELEMLRSIELIINGIVEVK